MAQIFITGSADDLGLLQLPTRPIDGGHKQSGIGIEATFETLHHDTLFKSLVVLNLEEGAIGDFHAPPPNAFV